LGELLDERWDYLADTVWQAFAEAWIAELQGKANVSIPDLPDLFGDGKSRDAGLFVVQMNFTASPQSQWRFIEKAFEVASDDELGDIAAGPVEHLMGSHGESFIDLVEERARKDRRFATMLGKCYRHGMLDEVWQRFCAVRIKGEAKDGS
jgi:hypothetical protein